ncbi:MAG: CotH kinase family protein [Bacteroidetes bacterium]|nr:CotH kinase family protein [Bacteroidota bacterium]MCB9043689.1 CotH kinase family protein [Chitinophagales bacterium]
MKNTHLIADRNGDYPTWIELYNAGISAKNLEGLYLSDNGKKLHKWMIPNVILPPNGTILIFTSGKNKLDQQKVTGSSQMNKYLHTNFKIKKGETLYLTDYNNVIDSVKIQSHHFNQSRGLFNNQRADTWLLFPNPTPDAPNSLQQTAQCYNESPEILTTSGFYNGSLWVIIDAATYGSEIHYTTDGNEPTRYSKTYTEPIEISKNTLLKAICTNNDCLPSKTVSRTYIMEDTPQTHYLASVFLSLDPVDLWSDAHGIYVKGTNAQTEFPFHGANFWKKWTVPAYFEFIDQYAGNIYQQNIGVRIHGAGSRSFDLKSLQLIADDKYGKKEFDNRFFYEAPATKMKKLLLKNAGQSFNKTYFNDALLHYIMQNGFCDVAAYKPVEVYINARYWGIQNLREKLDKYYLANKYFIKASDIEIVEGFGISAQSGGIENFMQVREFIINNSMQNEANYAKVQKMWDINGFCDFMITNIFAVNKDWKQAGNQKCWHAPTFDNGRWHFFLGDMDLTMGNGGKAGENIIGDVLRDGATHFIIFRKLLENPSFKATFCLRYTDLLNTNFTTENLQQQISFFAQGIEASLPHHYTRWGGNVETWKEKHLQEMYDFAEQRPAYARRYLKEQMSLGAEVPLTIENALPEGGTVKLNAVYLRQFPFEGTYYYEQNVELRALAAKGYKFAYFLLNDQQVISNAEIALTLYSPMKIKVVFEPE